MIKAHTPQAGFYHKGVHNMGLFDTNITLMFRDQDGACISGDGDGDVALSPIHHVCTFSR
jgi:hypothetical protein